VCRYSTANEKAGHCPAHHFDFGQLTVVSCIQKFARAGSSGQAAAIVFWHSTVGQAKTGANLSVIWVLSSDKR